MPTAGVDIDDGSPNNIISTIKDTKFYDLVVTLTAREIRNYQNILAKDLKGKFIGMNTKQKVRIKIQQMNIDISRMKLCWSQVICFSLFKSR